jgi:hypothetical protein
MKKILAIILIIVVVLIGITVVDHISKNGMFSDSKQKVCTMEAQICPDGSSVGRSGPNCEFAACPVATVPTDFVWKFDEVSSNGSTEPRTHVVLTYKGKTFDIGNISGNCSDIATGSWPLLKNEVAGAICYFAGGGEEIGVFSVNGTLAVKKGVVEEGDAENPGTRGDFKVLFTLP